ncbi:MAG: Uma2 family endonuclease [Anaerolineae bacterium]|nr:Uma2 family endonuclease [Anaerolineae bacterium]
MAVTTQPITVEEFERLAAQPENADRRLEFVGGESSEVVSNSYSSLVAARILIKLGAFLEGANVAGYLTGADGGYQVGDERYIPDVAFVAKARQPEPSRETYNPLAPDLAVEVLSPSDQPDVMRLKLANYLAAGTVVWVVSPETRTVEVYTPGKRAYRLSADGTLDGGDVLPGLALPVKDLFPD